MLQFANWYFLLFIPLILYIFILKKNKGTLKFSSIALIKNSGFKSTIKHKIGKYFILTGIIILVIALARPQSIKDLGFIQQDGIDIAMVLDVSGSMNSVDIKPSRLEVARKTIDDFILQRPNDRISLIIFAGTAYTKIPLTLDHNILRESLSELNSESVNKPGTAIGMSISVGINRLKKSLSSSKIMILLTDGDNNAGSIKPEAASIIAKDLGIKIYSIGVGTDKTILPVFDPFGRQAYDRYGQAIYQTQTDGGLNEDLLKEISSSTNGSYFRAKDEKTLSNVFENINQLETTEFEQDDFLEYTELAYDLMKIGLILLLIGILLEKLYFIRIP